MYHKCMGICKKPSLDVSEDVVGSCGDFYWLLDGATPPFGELNHKHTCLFVEEMNELLTMNSKRANSTQELMRYALADVKSVFEKRFDGNHTYLPYSTLIVVKVLENSIEYSILGDSTLGIRINNDISVISDKRLKKIAIQERLKVHQLRELGVSEISKQYTSARRILIETERAFQNVEGGYWVAGLQPDAAKNSINGRVDFREEDKVMIIIVSDGLERLVSIFNRYCNVCEIGDAIVEKGERYVFSQLRNLESDKSSFVRSISSKNDDASYVLLNR